MASDSRPLSPHLQIYKMPMAGLMSITHRATGVFLSLGTLALACFFLSAAAGPEAFASAQSCWNSWIGKLLMLGWAVSLYYHLGNGIRHLIWDAGHGLEIDQVNRSGIFNLVFTAVATIATVIAALV